MLDKQELKDIFSNLGPIYDLHIKLRADLMRLFHNWSDNNNIGKTILKYVSTKYAFYEILLLLNFMYLLHFFIWKEG